MKEQGYTTFPPRVGYQVRCPEMFISRLEEEVIVPERKPHLFKQARRLIR